MHYKFSTRISKSRANLATSVTIRNLVPSACKRSFQSRTLGGNKAVLFYTVIFYSLLVSSIPECVSCGDVNDQAESSESVTDVHKGVLSDDIEAQLESLGERSYLNGKLKRLARYEDNIYEHILQNIEYPPKVAGSIHLRPWVDDEYKWFNTVLHNVAEYVREFPCLLSVKKVKEVSDRVKRAVEDYRLYCEGRIPKENLSYIPSKKKETFDFDL